MNEDLEHIRNKCRNYLAEQKVSLWGKYFAIKDPEELEEAADWLAEQIMEVARESPYVTDVVNRCQER